MLQPPASSATSVVVLDASVWLSYVLRADVNRPLAHTWISNHVSNGGSFVAPHLLVVEVAATVKRVTQRERDARKALSELQAFSYLQILPMDKSLVEDAAEITILFGLRSGDAFYVTVAQQLNIPLVTFDHEQLIRPTSIITTIKP